MNERLTGATRHRAEVVGIIRRRVKLVLQVEVEWGDGPPDCNGMPEFLRGRGWRDADPADLAARTTGAEPPNV